MKRGVKAGFLKAGMLLAMPFALAGCYYEPGYYTRGDAYYGTEYYEGDGYYGGPGYYDYGPGYYGYGPSLGLSYYYGGDYYWRHRHDHHDRHDHEGAWNDGRSRGWTPPGSGDRGSGATRPPRGMSSLPSRSPGASAPSRGMIPSAPVRSTNVPSRAVSAPTRSMPSRSGNSGRSVR